MKLKNHIRWFVGMMACGLVTASQATIVETQTFSIGLGVSGTTNTAAFWTTNETSAANIYPGGNVTLTYAVNSPPFSSGGPGFPLRVLADQTGGQNSSGYNKETGLPDWGATMTATYTGPALLPNATIRIQIDSISLYGLVHSAPFLTGATADMAFAETTAGHAATSPSQNLNITTVIATAANFTQLVWNPADFNQALASATRTFALSTDGDNPTVDGFEFSGTIFVDDGAVPEPSVAMLGLVGGLLLWRKRRQA